MEYDLLNIGKKGLNWSKALPEYQNILNKDPKEVLEYRSPFEIYFAHKPCNNQNQNLESDEFAVTIANCKPTDAERNHCFRYAKDVREFAYAATKCCHRRMVNAHLKSNPPS